MPVSRRQFLRGSGGVPSEALSLHLISARGREALVGEARTFHGMEPEMVPAVDADEVRISSNENPLGPGQVAVQALLGETGQVKRYPFNSRRSTAGFQELLAEEFHAESNNIVLGAGSGEILRNAVRAFTSAGRPLVTADPSFENPVDTAKLIGSPIVSVPVDRTFGLDLDTMERAAQGAGLVFLCNPNNPTATVHSYGAVERFVSRLRQFSPETAILIDEAYHEYVTSRSYRTAIPLALSQPKVFVSRTFSKAFGMAGLRVGYAIGQASTIKRLAGYKLNININVLGVAAASAAFNDAAHLASEKARNLEVRNYVLGFFKSAGFATTDSQTNFIFVDIGRTAKAFREACAKHKVIVGRDFPPFEKTHARISLGTMQEMRRAVEVFQTVLNVAPATDAAR